MSETYKKPKIYLMGANGFIGSEIATYFSEIGVEFFSVTRNINNITKDQISLDEFQRRIEHLDMSDSVIINAIGAAHIRNKTLKNDPTTFEFANIELPCKIAQIALNANIRQFIQISSIGVLGKNCINKVNCATVPKPMEPYAQSKYRAELRLKDIFHGSNTSFFIVRPTLVYGENAKGNFNQLIKIIKTRIPLPLGKLKNKKSFVSGKNLASFIFHLIENSNIQCKTYNISDPDPVEFRQLLTICADELNISLSILNVSTSILKISSIILGASDLYNKLTQNFEVDMEEVFEMSGWTPIECQREGLMRVMKGMK